MNMKIIAFNSYKGGACRTTTCYNTLPYLAKKLGATSRKPILVFDTDLDSMGMTNILAGNAFRNASYSSNNLFVEDNVGIIRRIDRSGFRGPDGASWYYNLLKKVGNDLGLEDNGAVLFCGADMEAPTLSDDLYEKYKDSYPLIQLVRRLDAMPEEDRPVAMIFDCAAGLQMSTLAVLREALTSVTCMRPTMQFRLGTEEYLAEKLPKQIAKTGKKRNVILLPTSVASLENTTSPVAAKELQKLRASSYKKISSMIARIMDMDEGKLGYTLNYSMIKAVDDMGLPEIERFKWEEGLLYGLQNLTEKEKSLAARYEELAQNLANG